MNQVLAAAVVTLLLPAPCAVLSSGTVVQSVRVSPGADGTVTIVIEANGPLPVPTVGVVEGPPRVYLDFPDVTTATAGIGVEGSPLVCRVRVALNQAQPEVTRVVIGLRRAAPYRVEASGRERGQVTVIIGAPSAARPAAAPVSPQAPGAPSRAPSPAVSGTVVRSVRVAPGPDGVAITVEADGPLPLPTTGVVEGPPRIYLDFRDVTTTTAGSLVSGSPLVRRVRVALNQAQPPVTRVVIELTGAAPHRVDTAGRERGSVKVVVGGPATGQPAPPSPRVAAPETPAKVALPKPTGAAPPARPTAPPGTPPSGTRPAARTATPPAPAADSRTPRPATSAVVVRSVRLAPGSDRVAITVEADGPLPSPAVGVAQNPSRIYLDFPEVSAPTMGIPLEGNPLVRQVRLALNQAQPPVTRVVIELATAVPHRVEASGRERGRVTVVVGPPAASAARGTAPPAPPPPTSPPAAAPKPAPTVPDAHPAASPPPSSPKPGARAAPLAASNETAARAPEKDVLRYLQQAAVSLDRLEQLRPVLASLDALAPVPGARLRAAVDEFGFIRQALTATQPPPTLAVTHELLDKVCVLGALSATTRLEAVARGDPATAWNAASAAASAMMLLDQARSELGLSPGGSREKK